MVGSTIALLILANAWVHRSMCELVSTSATLNRTLGHASLREGRETILEVHAAHLIWAMSLLSGGAVLESILTHDTRLVHAHTSRVAHAAITGMIVGLGVDTQ